jgi:hypothetical protein
MSKRKQIYSFTADPDMVETAIAVACACDKNFSQFVSDALEEKIKKEIGEQPIEITKQK